LGDKLVFFFFFLSSTTLCEFWLAQLFLSMVSFPVPSVSNYLLPSSSNSSLTSSSHLNLRLPFGLVVCGFHFINAFNYSFIRHSFNMTNLFYVCQMNGRCKTFNVNLLENRALTTIKTILQRKRDAMKYSV